MAAPDNKTIHNLTGRWQMNKSLSDNFEPVLALQGVGYLMRKAINVATLTLHVRQFEAPPSEPALDPIDDGAKAQKVVHIDIDQTMTGGIKGTTEKRCLDDRRREHSDWLFGHVIGRTLWFKGPEALAAITKEFGDDFLAKGWPEPDTEDYVVSHVVNQDASGGWVATQVWGFQTAKDGARRHVRNIVVTKGEGSKQERVAVQLVYDYLGPLEDDDEALNY